MDALEDSCWFCTCGWLTYTHLAVPYCPM